MCVSEVYSMSLMVWVQEFASGGDSDAKPTKQVWDDRCREKRTKKVVIKGSSGKGRKGEDAGEMMGEYKGGRIKTFEEINDEMEMVQI